MKRSALFSAFALASSTVLASCGSPEQPAEEPEKVERLVVENARVVLPAVSGNPAAAYLDVTYNSGGAPTIESVSVEGAEDSQLHGTDMVNGTAKMGKAAPIALMARQTVNFAPGGLHVMVMDPVDSWKAGDKVNITVKLDNGEEATTPAEVQAPGDER